jgi:uncharacterized protein
MDFVFCPRCKKQTQYQGNPNRPFCSDRCRNIDLGNWASEKYAVPVESSNEDQSQSEFEDQNDGQIKIEN